MSIINLSDYGLSGLKKCPYCGKDAIFMYISANNNTKDYEKLIVNDTIKKGDSYAIYREYFRTFTCAHCDRTIFAHSKLIGNGYTNTYIYPNKAFIDLPKEIIATFPVFVEIFSQALQAKAHNFNHLVGSGLRKAVEFLITEYLLKIQGLSGIEKIKFAQKIEKLDKSIYATPCADLIRIFGNDETHYINSNEIDIEDAIAYVYALCKLMGARITALKAEEEMKSLGKKKDA